METAASLFSLVGGAASLWLYFLIHLGHTCMQIYFFLRKKCLLRHILNASLKSTHSSCIVSGFPTFLPIPKTSTGEPNSCSKGGFTTVSNGSNQGLKAGFDLCVIILASRVFGHTPVAGRLGAAPMRLGTR